MTFPVEEEQCEQMAIVIVGRRRRRSRRARNVIQKHGGISHKVSATDTHNSRITAVASHCTCNGEEMFSATAAMQYGPVILRHGQRINDSDNDCAYVHVKQIRHAVSYATSRSRTRAMVKQQQRSRRTRQMASMTTRTGQPSRQQRGHVTVVGAPTMMSRQKTPNRTARTALHYHEQTAIMLFPASAEW